MEKKREKGKQARILEEEKRLQELFRDLPKNELLLLGRLISEAAFIKVTMEDLKQEVNENGATEIGVHGTKLNANLTAYQNIVKTYSTIVKRLFELLPDSYAESKLEAFLNE